MHSKPQQVFPSTGWGRTVPGCWLCSRCSLRAMGLAGHGLSRASPGQQGARQARGRRSRCTTGHWKGSSLLECQAPVHEVYCRSAETSVCSVAGGLGLSSPSEAYLALVGFSALVPDWCRLPAPRALLVTRWYWILLLAYWAGVPPSCEPLHFPSCFCSK